MKRTYTVAALPHWRWPSRARAGASDKARCRESEDVWIDTEGGAATLLVSPSGESLLIDTGYPDGDRDAKRIVAAAQEAGLKKIDTSSSATGTTTMWAASRPSRK